MILWSAPLLCSFQFVVWRCCYEDPAAQWCSCAVRQAGLVPCPRAALQLRLAPVAVCLLSRAAFPCIDLGSLVSLACAVPRRASLCSSAVAGTGLQGQPIVFSCLVHLRSHLSVKSVFAQCSLFSVPVCSWSVYKAGSLRCRAVSEPVLLAPINAHSGTTCARTVPIAGAAALVFFSLGYWNCLNQAIVCVN